VVLLTFALCVFGWPVVTVLPAYTHSANVSSTTAPSAGRSRK
jgi:hypothetical protein